MESMVDALRKIGLKGEGFRIQARALTILQTGTEAVLTDWFVEVQAVS